MKKQDLIDENTGKMLLHRENLKYVIHLWFSFDILTIKIVLQAWHGKLIDHEKKWRLMHDWRIDDGAELEGPRMMLCSNF